MVGSDVACIGKSSVALVTVAQALHWFDVPRRMTEFQKRLTPNGVFATWFYGTRRLEAAPCDAIFKELKDASQWKISAS